MTHHIILWKLKEDLTAAHPDHVAVAYGRVRPYTVGRYCMDYEDR